MGGTCGEPSPAKGQHPVSNTSNCRTPALIADCSNSMTTMDRTGRPTTPPVKWRTDQWHGLPSPDTPFSGYCIDMPPNICLVDRTRTNGSPCAGKLAVDPDEEAHAAVNAIEQSSSIEEVATPDFEESVSASPMRRSKRTKKQAVYHDLCRRPGPEVRRSIKAEPPPTSSVPETSRLSETAISTAKAEPVSFDGFPALRSLDWELQYPPGGSTHPSYPYPNLDPRLVVQQPFVPVVDGLPDVTKAPKLELPMGWHHVSWCGLLPIVFDSYHQGFKLTPVGPLPLTCEELHQGGLQDYVPGGSFHLETACLPPMFPYSDGSVDDVYNWDGVDWTLPMGNGGLPASPADPSVSHRSTDLPGSDLTLRAPSVPWREERDCPNLILDVQEAWAWFTDKITNPTADFQPKSTVRPRNGAYRSAVKFKSPIPELLIGAMLASPEDPNPVLVNQDNRGSTQRNLFCPLKSVATPVSVDMTLLADTEITLMELLCYFPQHYHWGHAAERLARAGVQPASIKNVVNMTRGLEGVAALKSCSVNSAVAAAKKRIAIERESSPVEGEAGVSHSDEKEKESESSDEKDQIEQGKDSENSNAHPPTYTASHWTYNLWVKTDYPLLALRHGLQEQPTGLDAGPLTSLMQWCLQHSRLRVLLSDVPALLLEAGIAPRIPLSERGQPDMEFFPRYREALKWYVKRVKWSQEAYGPGVEEGKGGRKRRRVE